jgi:hypothetical protein
MERVMKCEMYTENDEEGRGWERQRQYRLQRSREASESSASAIARPVLIMGIELADLM